MTRTLPTPEAVTGRPTIDQLWAWLADVPDPEIPAVSIVDLGIVRDVAWSEADADTAIVTVTPTYSGCPATAVIREQIRTELLHHGVERVELRIQLSPAWTTDWLTERAKQNLQAYGIAPPLERADKPGDALSASLVVLGQGAHQPRLACPRCGSTHNETISRFGSTPCKSLHRCLDCLEPFDHFKCH
ncbi:MAG: phenylacetate-CoA oxygenase subunit PaaJ [Acidobacteriota bacterium]|nr:phenylacetate-CoA oxygenase subunit PaaJ [Acidobacteriota bacterium]